MTPGTCLSSSSPYKYCCCNLSPLSPPPKKLSYPSDLKRVLRLRLTSLLSQPRQPPEDPVRGPDHPSKQPTRSCSSQPTDPTAKPHQPSTNLKQLPFSSSFSYSSALKCNPTVTPATNNNSYIPKLIAPPNTIQVIVATIFKLTALAKLLYPVLLLILSTLFTTAAASSDSAAPTSPPLLEFTGVSSTHWLVDPGWARDNTVVIHNPQNSSAPFKLTFRQPSSSSLAARSPLDLFQPDEQQEADEAFAFLARRQTSQKSTASSTASATGNLLSPTSIPGAAREGVYIGVYIGSPSQPVLCKVDTMTDLLITNAYNKTASEIRAATLNSTSLSRALQGFEPSNSSTYQAIANSHVDMETLTGHTINGSMARDTIGFSSHMYFEGDYNFLLAENNTVFFSNIFSIIGNDESVTENELSSFNFTAFSSTPANIVGLGPPESDNSFLQQLYNLGKTTSKLFSLGIDSSSNVSLNIGSIDTSRFNSTLFMQPILRYMYSANMSHTGYSYPFITMTALTLTNYKMNNTISYSDNELSLPVLLDISSSISFLPYTMVVYLASQIGAYYSSDLKAWIQTCSYRDAEGSIGFSFYNVTINVPLADIIVPIITSDGDRLYFESGDQACALSFLPSEARGFASLGTTFFESAYSVFDYENMLVGLAQLNSNSSSSSASTLSSSPKAITKSVDEVVNATTYYPTGFPPTAMILSPQTSYYNTASESLGTLLGLVTLSGTQTTQPKSLATADSGSSSAGNSGATATTTRNAGGLLGNTATGNPFTQSAYESTPFGAASGRPQPHASLVCTLVALLASFMTLGFLF